MKHLFTKLIAVSLAGLASIASAEPSLVVAEKLARIERDLNQQLEQILDALETPKDPVENAVLNGIYEAAGDASSCIRSTANYLYIYSIISNTTERKSALEIIMPEINFCTNVLGSTIEMNDRQMAITDQKSTYLLAQSIKSNYTQAASLMQNFQFSR